MYQSLYKYYHDNQKNIKVNTFSQNVRFNAPLPSEQTP